MGIISKIKSVLKKKKELVVLDLYLRDYEHSNFYFALVFNKKIEKFKVLYVPIDVVDEKDSVEDYFCYQFIFVETVNYILETINRNEYIYKNDAFRNRKVSTMDSYYIELNTHVASKDYKFMFTQFIDKDFLFLFDIIVILFEHLPNIVNELCNKLLFNFYDSNDAVKFDVSCDFDLFDDPYSKIFSKDIIDNCNYIFDDIFFIEKVGHRYYAVIDNNVFVLEYLRGKKIFNINCNNFNPFGTEIFIIVKAIREKLEKKFYRLKVFEKTLEFTENGDLDKYYLCYGISDNKFLIANNVSNDVGLNLLKKKYIKILQASVDFKSQIVEYLSMKYTDGVVNDIIEFIFN